MREEFVLLSQAAKETGYSAERIRQLIKHGDVTGHQIGGRYWVISRASLAALKARPRKRPGPQPGPRKRPEA